jgi:hypothetical protein
MQADEESLVQRDRPDNVGACRFDAGVRFLLGLGDVDIPENLREWRNLIHPGACLQNYKLDEDLTPEVCTAAGQLQIVLRDLP